METHGPDLDRSATVGGGRVGREHLCKNHVKSKRRKEELTHVGLAHVNCWDDIGSGYHSKANFITFVLRC